MHAGSVGAATGQQLIEADEMIHPVRDGLGRRDGVALGRQSQTGQQVVIDQGAGAFALVVHLRPPFLGSIAQNNGSKRDSFCLRALPV